jgi:hypothetical protein
MLTSSVLAQTRTAQRRRDRCSWRWACLTTTRTGPGHSRCTRLRQQGCTALQDTQSRWRWWRQLSRHTPRCTVHCSWHWAWLPRRRTNPDHSRSSCSHRSDCSDLLGTQQPWHWWTLPHTRDLGCSCPRKRVASGHQQIRIAQLRKLQCSWRCAIRVSHRTGPHYSSCTRRTQQDCTFQRDRSPRWRW